MAFSQFLFLIFGFAFAVVVLGSVTKIILAFINRKAMRPRLPAELADRLERIEQIVETTAIEVERISEAQRFTAKVLAERAAPAGLPPSHAHGRVVTPH